MLSASDSPKPAIYSSGTVLGFSLFSPLVGGALAFSSLRAAGQSAAAWRALLIGVSLLTLTLVLNFRLFPAGGGLSLLINLGGGFLLRGLLRRHVPDEAAYPQKSIVMPLAICLGLCVLFVALVLVGVPIYLAITTGKSY